MTSTFTDFTVTDAADKTFLYTNLFLQNAHLHVYRRPLGDEDYTETTDFGLVGGSGSVVATLTGATAAALAVGDVIRIRRQTPSTPLVTFVQGSLRATDLNLVTVQNLYRSEEGIEISSFQTVVVDTGGTTVMALSGDAYDAGGNRIEDVADAVNPEDAVNLAQMSTAIAAIPEGDTLPGAVTASDMLYVSGGEWVVGGPSVIRGNLGLGTAALLTSGVAAGVDLPTRADADARFFQRTGALGELITDGTQSTARGNLGLTSAAVTAMGTSASEIVQLDGSARLPAVDGSQLDLSAHTSLNGNGGHYQLVTGTSGGDQATGADKDFGKGARVKFGVASEDSHVVNGGPTVNAVSALKSWTLEFGGAATEVNEIEITMDMEVTATMAGKTLTVRARTSTTLDGSGAWADFTSPREVVIPSAATTGDIYSFKTRVFVTGPLLFAIETLSSSGTCPVDIRDGSAPMISVRRLNL